ncbi:DUF1549 domain-containing protein [Thalassoglobus sp. JC818]|uniref:DUF1549 domain-containing protein n=1 Tax=Thalassoglobus sp. JC818 TaxID=3232136 RepID=UPI0034579513
MFRTCVEFRTCCFLLVVLVCTWGIASETLPPANQRYRVAEPDGIPDFQRHVAPLLGRLGCNGRNCHGSFQGRGNFRLSLFGYDFDMDHRGLTGEATSEVGQRIDPLNPAESLILTKPTMKVEHEGGERFRTGSWEYHLIHRWIEAGASKQSQPQELQRLELFPTEILFGDGVESAQLRVIAIWRNGDEEDVTPLCRYRINDDSVATVNADGEVTSKGDGDTHVIAFYDNGIGSVPVMRAASSQGFKPSSIDSVDSPIDQFVETKLNKLKLTPSELCSDSEFLRRVSIDLTGTLPTPDEVRSFLKDSREDKRNRKIDELLDRPAYAAWWANKLCDYTGCNPQQQAELSQELSVQWYMWLLKRIENNAPYDEIVERIVLAKSRLPGQTYEEYAAETSAYFSDGSEFSSRETMPHYWTRRSMQEPAQAAEAFAHNFLGLRLQCAQCHKHPFAQWTQADYQEFSRFFETLKFGVRSDDLEQYRQMAQRVGMNAGDDDGSPVRNDALRQLEKGSVFPWRELYIKERETSVEISLLRSKKVTLEGELDPREEIMDWMSQPDNPWFAQAFVNRVWSAYFHRGIVDPPDDLNPANPPTHPKLLAWLTESFIEHNYDMKWLHREIVSSRTYQRSWKPSHNNQDDRKNYSRTIPKRMPAEVVYDSVKQVVTASDATEEVRTDLTRRASGHLSMRLAGTYAMQIFGKPERVANCDCERNNAPTLLQTVFLQNDPIIEQRLENSGWLQEIANLEAQSEISSRTALIEEAWMRALCRLPNEAELERSLTHLASAESITDGMQDILWALLNTKEFLLIK